MVVEKISCPDCGKITEVGIPENNEITQIKKEKIWNFLVLTIRNSKMTTKCQHCNNNFVIWFKKRKWDSTHGIFR